jgi:hypothetical protein
MRSPREKQREARLLLIISALTEGDGAQAVDVFALDFLLQHPSLLIPYVRGTKANLPPHAVPGSAETDSSEEALLRWKRSVGDRTLAPMIGRLIARGLVRRVTNGRFSLTSRGIEAVEELLASDGAIEGERLPGLAAHLSQNRAASRQALFAALGDAS